MSPHRWQKCELKFPGPGLPKVVTAGCQDHLVCMESFTVDSEDHVEQLALCTEGSQTLQEAGTVASCREGAVEGPAPISQAAKTAEDIWLRALQVGTHLHTDTEDIWNCSTE